MAGSDIGVLPPGMTSPAAFPFTNFPAVVPGLMAPRVMTLLSLTPTPQPRTGSGAPVSLSSLLATGALGPGNNGVSFSNTGREVLHVQVGAVSTIIVAIGTTIEGQPVSPITLTPAPSSIAVVGPFPSDENQAGGLIQVTFGTPANIIGVALLQNAGVF